MIDKTDEAALVRYAQSLERRLEALQSAAIAAKSLLTIDMLSPAVHSFEIEKRDKARESIIGQIDRALLNEQLQAETK